MLRGVGWWVLCGMVWGAASPVSHYLIIRGGFLPGRLGGRCAFFNLSVLEWVVLVAWFCLGGALCMWVLHERGGRASGLFGCVRRAPLGGWWVLENFISIGGLRPGRGEGFGQGFINSPTVNYPRDTCPPCGHWKAGKRGRGREGPRQESPRVRGSLAGRNPQG